MKLEEARVSGFCFGVKNIDKKTREALSKPGRSVYSYGELVHNDLYLKKREEEGLKVLDSLDQSHLLDKNSILILRAHGVLKEERQALEKTGAEIVDGTCPILLSIYKLAQEENKKGKQIVIIGDPKHPEVRAIKSYLADDTKVIHTLEEAKAFRSDKDLFVISQTTNREEFFESLVEALKENNKLQAKQTICNATHDRQEACKELAQKSDAMVVIGGRQSSNTQKLYEVAKKYCKNCYKCEKSSDLPLQSLCKLNRIGVIAGASTPDWIIEEVVQRMDQFTEEFMEKIDDSMVKIYPRDIVKGTVIAVKEDEVFVDIHFRADGIIKSNEMTPEERENPKEAFHAGDEIDVYVIKLDDGEGNVALSTNRVEGLKHWQKLVDKYEAGETVDALVTGTNRGGLIVKVMGINGFIPASQITTYYVKNFKQFVGQTLECAFLSIDERKRRVVLSSRAVAEKKMDEVWDTIIVGETIKGKVVRMTDFGAFVDLGGVDGLIHVSDIAWQRIDKPSDVLEIGQEVEPLVLKANRARNRISLGLKQLKPKPFEVFVKNNKVGDVVKAKVVNMLDFGAFVRLKEGVEGLVHVSQIANHHVDKPSDELSIGEEVTVKILNIEEERQRIALSIKALQEPTEEEKKARPTAAQNADRYERRPANQQQAQASKTKERKPRRERRKPQQKINFSDSGDIGTNLGDLIAAQLGLVEGEEAEDAENEEKADNQDVSSSEKAAQQSEEDETSEEMEEASEETSEEEAEQEPEA